MKALPALLLLVVAPAMLAQSADEWRFRGDFHAEREQHSAAADAYERAIDRDPSLRPALAARLARELLWSERSHAAAELFAEHLDAHPADCEARNDYGLALAWSGRPGRALREYEIVIAGCAAVATQARLRAAMAARWDDRPSLAERLYRTVLDDGSDAEKAEARAGLAYVQLMRDQNRRALRSFESLRDPAGSAIARYRLGRVAEAEKSMAEAESRGPLSRDLLDLRELIHSAERVEIRPAFTQFRDADTTTFDEFQVEASRSFRRVARAGVAVGRSRVGNRQRHYAADWLELSGDYRSNDEIGGGLVLRRSVYREGTWRPVSGEAHVVWTPSDAWRADLAVARISITDNVAAVEKHLSGDFLSIGADRRVSAATSVVASIDRTRWSTRNNRTRARLNWTRRFEGVPRLTVEWPTLLQVYDEPFEFALFSPRQYVETGPAINLYRRYRRHWNLSAYLRGGAQRENGRSWQGLATARVAAERDLAGRWALRASAAWSNSNLNSSSGFRRTSMALEIARRF